MDLGAFVNRESIDALAKANGIEVPSLRGYRIMSEEEVWDDEYIAECEKNLVGDYWWSAAGDVNGEEAFNDWLEHNREDYANGYRPANIPKSRISKEFRKDLGPTLTVFDRVSMLRARWHRQAMLWNRYAGHEGVLYIHSRMGGDGRTHSPYYKQYSDKDPYWPEGWDVRDQMWFLDVCADAFDPTYCDIYARINRGGIEWQVHTSCISRLPRMHRSSSASSTRARRDRGSPSPMKRRMRTAQSGGRSSGCPRRRPSR